MIERPSRPLVPTLGQLGDLRLPPNALAYLDARSVLDSVASGFVGVVAAFILSDGGLRWVFIGLVSALSALAILVELRLLNRLHVRYVSYTIDSDFVYVTRGAIFRVGVIIATRQILNVEAVQGPVLQRFGYTNVRFQFITGSVTLGPLDARAVTLIRETIASTGSSG